MRNLLAFKNEEGELFNTCPCRDDIREMLWTFHKNLLEHCSMPTAIQEETGSQETEEKESPTPSLRDRLLELVWKVKEEEITEEARVDESKIGRLHHVIDCHCVQNI